MRIEVFYDYICPWCYAALDRVAYLERRHGAEVVWRPFELHPDWPRDGMDAPRYDRAGLLRRLMSQTDLPFTGRTTVTNSMAALALSTSLASEPWWPDLHRRLFEAYWAEQRNLGSIDTLREICGEFSVGAKAVDSAIDTGVPEVLASKDEAVELGIAATPGWHFGNGVVFPGVHEPEVFDRIVARLSASREQPARD